MLEIVVIAILAVAVAGGVVLSAGEKEAVSRTWPVIRAEGSKSEPAEEGAPVREGEPFAPAAALRKAA
ncbi:MAG: hypothetical protein ACM3NF_04540 [Gemmatimonadota bacterium]